jgi:hypothetical protein
LLVLVVLVAALVHMRVRDPDNFKPDQVAVVAVAAQRFW